MSRRGLFLQTIAPPIDAFVLNIQTNALGTSADNEFTLQAFGTYDVDWGDNNIEFGRTGNLSHTYAIAGNYDIAITGGLQYVQTQPLQDQRKILDIKQWGSIQWTQMKNNFRSSNSINCSASDTPDLSALLPISGEQTIDRMFIDSNMEIFPNVGNWDVSTIQNFDYFARNNNWDESLENWDITLMETAFQFRAGNTEFSTPNYNKTLIGWENTLQATYPNGSGYTAVIDIHFGFSKYTLSGTAETARTSLINNYGWTITDGGGTNEYIISVQTDNAGISADNQFTLPVLGTGLEYAVETSDGQILTNNESDLTITFPTAGTYDLKITGTLKSIYFNNGGDKDKLIEIKQWGSIVWENMIRAYNGCTNLTIVSANDIPDLSSITNFNTTFGECSSLTSINRIGEWDVSGINSIQFMFINNPLFNSDLSTMNFSSTLTSVEQVFQNNDLLDTSFGGWDVSNVSTFNNFLRFTSGISTANYDDTLIGWEDSLQTAFPNGSGYTKNIDINFQSSKYTYNSAASLARQSLIDTFGWTITDGGATEGAYILTVKTDNIGVSADNQFKIPTRGGGVPYNYNVKTSDGQVITGLTATYTITFPSAGTYDIEITGDYRQSYTIGGNDPEKFIEIKQWGDKAWINAEYAWYLCVNLDVTATDIPDFSNVTNMTNAFRGSTALASMDTSGWDVSNVQNMGTMFGQLPNLNPDVTNWNTSSLTTIETMFVNSDLFDRDLSGWDITNVTRMVNFLLSADGLSTPNYDSTLIGWENNLQATFPDGSGYTETINVHFGSSKYTLGSTAETARTSLINNYGWTITDGGSITPTILTVKTDNAGESADNQVLLKTDGTLNYDIATSDGQNLTNNTGDLTITFPTAGTYDLEIYGKLAFSYNGSGDRLKLIEISQWGDVIWESFLVAFRGCNNLVISASDVPDLTVASNFDNGFREIFDNPNNVENWDVSNITNMQAAFRGTNIGVALTNWDITNVSNFTLFNSQVGGLSTPNYEATLIGWEQTLQVTYPDGVGYPFAPSCDFGNAIYTLGNPAETARTSLINNFNWTITDGGGIEPPITGGLLFDSPDASAAYSLRALNTYDNGYEQELILVRRSNDNAESGFTASQISGGTLTTWVGGGNDGFVKTWYDQSGSGNDAIAPSDAAQPILVSGGTLNLLNGKPVINLDGINDVLLASGVTTTPSFNLNMVGTHTDDFGFFQILTSTNDGIEIIGLVSNIRFSLSGDDDLRPNTIGAQQLISFSYLNPDKIYSINNSEILDTFTGPYLAGVGLELGSRLGVSYGECQYQEIIYWNGDTQISNRASIKLNINNYYTIY